MNSISKLLATLKALDIKLWIDEGQLRVNGPDAALTPALVAELQAHKAQLLALLQRAPAAANASTITPADRSQPLPLSFAQQRLWFLDQLGSGFAYNIPGALQLVGPLQVTALHRALQAIVQRHESLRTTFGETNGMAYQRIHPEMAIDLPIINLTTYAPTEQRAEAERLIATEATRPFDLQRDPMLRATLLRLTASPRDSHPQSTDPAKQPADHHILLLILHHIAADGWSMGILVRELAALYRAFIADQPSPLPALPIQYADFARWQRNYLQGERLAQQLAYWQARLLDVPQLLQLPTDRPRPAQQRFRGGMVRLTISADLTQQVRRLSQERGATLYMTLLAAFQLLLARYSGQTDVVVGSPIANRNHRAIEPLIGFFVNTLVLRANLSATDGQPLSFLDLLAQVRETTQTAYDHQDLPFERLVEALQPDRSLNYNPLVQVSFALQNASIGDLSLPGVAATPMPVQAQSTRFDLEMELFETGTELAGHCIYNSDIFDESTIRRLTGHYQTLLAGIVAAPHQSVAELPLLTAAERHQLLFEWNGASTSAATAAESSNSPTDAGGRCVHQLFEEQAARTPDAIALLLATVQLDHGQSLPGYGSAKLTYGGLNEQANQLAHHLLARGATPGTPVGICLERSLEMIVGLLAIFKAGCIYVPLDPAYPDNRVHYMLRDSQAEILLTTTTLARRFADASVAVLELDRAALALLEARRDNPRAIVDPKQLAYVIYTSGSTGEPKGVMVEHGALTSHIQTATEHYRVTATDCILQFASTSFDVSLEQIFVALCSGAKLVMRDHEIWTPEAFDRYRLAHQITVLNLPPAYFQQLLQHWTQPPNTHKPQATFEVGHLRLILVGGEKFVLDVVKLWQQLAHAHPPLQTVRLLNVYGPTECTITAMAYDLAEYGTNLQVEAESLLAPPIAIGRPLDKRTAYILDAHLQPTPVGVPGELHIGGLCLARGYLNRPQLTDEKFIPNPFTAQADRLYKTGDLCRYMPDGNIEFLGRIDNQVKVQGFRIELGEIETALRRHPAVRDAVVLARQDQRRNQQLVAYLVTDQGDAESAVGQVQSWQRIYEETYGQTPEQVDLTFNLTGWNSSYTGEPIPAAEMAEWVAETVADIRRLKPTRVWEIGCGTGLLLSRLAADCTVYWGTDYSRQALDQVERLKTTRADLSHIHLDQRMADDFSGIEAGQFDCIILNSIIQYFPSVDYLLTVLTGAVRAVRPGGVVYVGDVRNLQLLHAYHAAVQSHQAADDLPLPQLQARIQQRMQDEEELLIDPAFFQALPGRLPQIEQVDIALKRGNFHNELTQFRYQVVLHVGPDPQAQLASMPATPALTWRKEEWSQGGWSVATLVECLQQLAEANAAPHAALVMHNIPNARVEGALDLLARLAQPEGSASPIGTVGQLRADRADQAPDVDPVLLWSLGETLPYRVHVTWANLPGRMDAYFIPRARAESTPNRLPLPQHFIQPPQANDAGRAYTNNPLLGKLHRTLTPKIRAWLQQALPDYMLPASYVLLEQLPLTPNGKVDRQALPAPTYVTTQAQQILPRTPTEERLATIWQEVLGLEPIGVTDNFFEIGGHSLTAIQIVSRIRRSLQIEVPLRSFFAAPTIAELSIQLTRAGSVLPPIEPIARDGNAGQRRFPLSFAQQRLWILMQLDEISNAYNMPLVLRFSGAFDIDAFMASWQQLEARHEALRTFFPQCDGQAYQQIQPSGFGINLIDLTSLLPAQQEAEVTRLARHSAEQPFDLAHAPLWRGVLLRLDPQTHILLLTMHHIISDGWSMNILLREWAMLYTAQQQGQPVQLPDLPVQYSDFAEWQHQWLTGPHIKQQLDYWKQQLSTPTGAPLPILDLPQDFVRPAEQTFLGSYCQRRLEPALCQGLRTLSHAHEATLFMTLCAAFNLLLGRLAGQEDILIGTPAAGRNHTEIENLTGFFVNTLVLRTDLSGNPSFAGLLERVKQSTLAAYDHQDLPFEKLIEELQPVRDPNRTPLFQVWFNMLPEAQEIAWPELDVTVLHRGEPQAKFDLTFYVEEQAGGIQITAIYNVHLFTHARVESLLAQFHYLLEQIVQSPNRAIQRYSLRFPTEQSPLPDPTARLDPAWCPALHTRFVQQATIAADALAVVGPTTSFTYKALDALSNQLAHALLAQGIQSTDIVAIYAQRDPSLVLAILGILKAGATFMVLDVAYPAARLATYCAKVQPVALIVLGEFNPEDEIAIALTIAEQSVSCFEKGRIQLPTDRSDLCETLKPYPATAPDVSIQPDQPLYVTFTSGSTGQPNAIVGVHRPVAHFVDWQVKTFALSARDRFTMLSGLAHDPLLRDIFTPLSIGATLYVPAQDEIGAGQLARWLATNGITIAHLTPQIAQLWTAEAAPQNERLRYLFLGGDRLTRPLAQALQACAPTATVVNGYGATETPQLAAYAIISDAEAAATIPIGTGIEGVQLLVLTPHQELAGVGELGEIVVRTPYLAQGYLHDAALTQTRFIANPWCQEAQDRLYKTGDWGRYQPDGQVVFVGRADHQTKIRGFRVEPAEIEAVLIQHPRVRSAVVVTRNHAAVGEDPQATLVAYVVANSGRHDNHLEEYEKQRGMIAELRHHLAQQLPSYMMPSTFMLLTELPLTPNGKVDISALPAPDLAESPAHAQRPRTPVEQQLVALWAETLGVRSVDIHANFFALGGHSLLAMQLLTKINKHFGRQLSLRILFQQPTVATLAQFLEQAEIVPVSSSLVLLQPRVDVHSTKSPFYCLPGAGGSVYYLYALAQALGPTQPFYALESLGLDGKTAPFMRIEDAAAYHIERLQQQQPRTRGAAPYQLGGHSFGGVIAFEMAQQLLQAGAEVAPLILLDSRLIGMTPPPFDEVALILAFEEVLIKEFGCRPTLKRAQLEPLASEARLMAFKAALETAGVFPAASKMDPIRGIYNVWKANAQTRYTPSHVQPLLIHLLIATEQADTAIQTKIEGWSAYADVTVHRVPGTHDSMLYAPHVTAVAQVVAACLESNLKIANGER